MTEAEVYYKYKKKVYGLAFTLVMNEFDAKDITSDVFEKYIRYIKSNNTFKNEKHMERWFVRVTKTTVTDYFRSKKVKYTHEMEDDINDMEVIPEDDNKKSDFVVSLERKLAHEETISKLNPRYREVLIMYFDFGYTIKEISIQMNESEANVKTLLYRAKKKYKEIAESEGENNE